MRGWLLALGIVVAFTIQTAIAPILSPFGLIPDLILLLVISIALLKGPVVGMGIGLVGGLLTDCLAGGIIGVHAMAKMVIGLSCGLMEKTIFKDNFLVPSVTVWIGTLVHDLIIGLIYSSFGWETMLFNHLWRYTFPLMFYHAILAPFIYYLVFFTERRLMLRNS
ncbi:MAG TPA: rod shape-determining protein MreD [Bacillota bacterium]|nr:rod shape-determining protein MreD [Bacillota bacterium]